MIAQVESRNLAFSHGARSTTGLARAVLRIGAGEAAARVRSAAALGPRRSVSGQPLDPIYPAVAAAQAGGDISPRHAQLIVSTIENLSPELRAELDRTVEALLLDVARVQDPDTLAAPARDLAYRQDQDGQYDEHRIPRHPTHQRR